MALAKAKKGKISVKEMKSDPMWQLYEKVGGTIQPYTDKLKYGVMGIVAAVALFSVIYFFMNYQKNSGQVAFAKALEIYSAEVIIPGSEEDKNKNPGKKTFTDEQQKYKEAAAAFDQVANSYSSHREMAKYYAAMSRTYFEAAKGQAELEELAKLTDQVGFLAKMGLAESYASGEQADRAITIYQQLKDNPGPIPKSLIFYNLGYLYERQSNNSEAIKAYFESASLDRTSDEGRKSQERLNVLDPATAKKLPPEKKEEES